MNPMKRAKFSDDNVHSHGGVVPMLKKLNALKIPELINSILGKRPPQCKYPFDKAIISYIMSNFCFGHALRRIKHASNNLSIIQGLRFPNHSTLGRIFKKLSTQTEYTSSVNLKNDTETKYYAQNENYKLNDLLIQMNKRMGLLKEGTSYTLDMDATYIKTEKEEANMTYKKHRGFTAMVCMINKVVVYVSLRSGNSGPQWNQLDCLRKTIDLLSRHNIRVGTVRIDGAGYQNNILSYLNSEKIKFIVGGKWAKGTYNLFKNAFWEKKKFETSTHCWDAEFAIMPFSFSKCYEIYHMCAVRVKYEDRHKDEQSKEFPTKWVLRDGYYYKFIINSEEYASPYEVVNNYNERGASEVVFAAMKQDFGWNIPPFGKLNHNLVYLLITAMANTVYEGLLKFFSQKIYELGHTIRIRTFFEQFISVRFSYDEVEGRYTFHRKKVGFDMKDVIFRWYV
jgi:hypothetical protein